MSFIGYTEGLSAARTERFFVPGARLTLLEFADGSTYGTPRSLIDDPYDMMRDADMVRTEVVDAPRDPPKTPLLPVILPVTVMLPAP